MNSRLLLRFTFLFLCTTTLIQAQSLGIFENNHDVGAIKHPGNTIYDIATQTYTLTGSGTNIWGTQDEFQYAWKSIQGDFILRAQMEFIGEGVDPHRKIGWAIRNNFHTGSPMAVGTVHGDGLTSLQYRKKSNGEVAETKSTAIAPDIIQLERRGNTYIMSTAKFGEAFTSVSVELTLRNEVFVGLFICAHNPEVTEKAIFKNVRIVKPAPADLKPYQDYLGSRLEIMDVTTGERKILTTSAHSIQAPNWTPDGKTLIYNSNGLLYNYDLETGKISMLNSGFATRNNNDHVLNTDGTKIAISHHNDDDNGNSAIYHLPITGSDTPIKVTKTGVGASYLHGWSPNGKKMLFTGDRKGQYDIYELDVATGKEKQLTNTKTLDDGAEYSSNGTYIYFNSNRTGTMQAWRMKADGSEQTQLTHDGLNDWFPHISPDVQKIVLISFPKEIPSGDHPFYKHCVLRIMPATGGTPKVIAHLYGGQGTINVPSWSPDSKYIAFVSNTAAY